MRSLVEVIRSDKVLRQHTLIGFYLKLLLFKLNVRGL